MKRTFYETASTKLTQYKLIETIDDISVLWLLHRKIGVAMLVLWPCTYHVAALIGASLHGRMLSWVMMMILHHSWVHLKLPQRKHRVSRRSVQFLAYDVAGGNKMLTGGTKLCPGLTYALRVSWSTITISPCLEDALPPQACIRSCSCSPWL
jgi:hypothetical protein